MSEAFARADGLNKTPFAFHSPAKHKHATLRREHEHGLVILIDTSYREQLFVLLHTFMKRKPPCAILLWTCEPSMFRTSPSLSYTSKHTMLEFSCEDGNIHALHLPFPRACQGSLCNA
jgi:hypothetical protein